MTVEIPALMRAVAITQPGGPEVLQIEERPVPVAGPGQVLLRVSHAGVNRPDVLQRLGGYPPPPGASDIPGLEVAGDVVAGAPEWIGRRVCALVTGGGYAQFCLARTEHCLPVPSGCSPAEAAALPETVFTVWHNLFERGMARDGETVLVHGGTSGIGTMAIKLAKLFGLTVVVTAGSDEKCAAARALGADHAINYRTDDFAERVKALGGAHVILDMVAGSYTQRNLDCLNPDGRLVTIAVLGGAQAQVNMAQVMMRRHTLTGSTLRARSDAFKALLRQEIEREVWPAVAEGTLRPAMDRIFPLAQASEAHARMEAGDHIGKIVLAVGDD